MSPFAPARASLRAIRHSPWLLCCVAVVLFGCAQDNRAQLCIDETKRRLEGHVYRLAEDDIQASERRGAEGTLHFEGDLILKPGTSREERQSIKCTVATDSTGVPSRVIGFEFIWGGETASAEMPAQ